MEIKESWELLTYSFQDLIILVQITTFNWEGIGLSLSLELL